MHAELIIYRDWLESLDKYGPRDMCSLKLSPYGFTVSHAPIPLGPWLLPNPQQLMKSMSIQVMNACLLARREGIVACKRTSNFYNGKKIPI